MRKQNAQAKRFGGWIGAHLRQRNGKQIGRGYHWGHCSKPLAINGDFDTADHAYEQLKQVHNDAFVRMCL
jgi:hypothetical protein